MTKCIKATTEHKAKALNYLQPPLLQSSLRVITQLDLMIESLQAEHTDN